MIINRICITVCDIYCPILNFHFFFYLNSRLFSKIFSNTYSEYANTFIKVQGSLYFHTDHSWYQALKKKKNC